jgi:SAM-dependent methyltransferase
MTAHVPLYDTGYRDFALTARRRVKEETYGEDIGQNSWLTRDEWDSALDWLVPTAQAHVLDVACGSGGPDLHFARTRGARVVGVDVNAHAIETATRAACGEGLASLARFVQADAGLPLPFADASFDAVVCIDAINHLTDRLGVLRDWHRVLKPGGRMMFTDPIVVTGLLSSEELARRASIGYFVFALRDEDERLVAEAGFDLLRCDDTTANVARVASRWHDARGRLRAELVADEGEQTFDDLQAFLATAHVLASERRLSRYTLLATRPAPRLA